MAYAISLNELMFLSCFKSHRVENDNQPKQKFQRLSIIKLAYLHFYQDNDDEPKTATSDTEKVPEDQTEAEFIEMKRRFTLVTAEEPIPPCEDDVKEHLRVIATLLPQVNDGTHKTYTQSHTFFALKAYSILQIEIMLKWQIFCSSSFFFLFIIFILFSFFLLCGKMRFAEKC